MAINIAPQDGWEYQRFWGQGGQDGLLNAQNGTNYLHSALNVEFSKVEGIEMNHESIVDLGLIDGRVRINPQTRTWTTFGIYLTLK